MAQKRIGTGGAELPIADMPIRIEIIGRRQRHQFYGGLRGTAFALHEVAHRAIPVAGGHYGIIGDGDQAAFV